MKESILTLIGVIGAAIASVFGGWSTSMTTLLIFMVIDYITGLAVAGIFHKSSKSETGALESLAGWKGLVRKCTVLLCVLISYRLDLAAGTAFIKDAVCIAFITNELLSITENAGIMGVPIPKPITDAIDILRKKNQE